MGAAAAGWEGGSRRGAGGRGCAAAQPTRGLIYTTTAPRGCWGHVTPCPDTPTSGDSSQHIAWPVTRASVAAMESESVEMRNRCELGASSTPRPMSRCCVNESACLSREYRITRSGHPRLACDRRHARCCPATSAGCWTPPAAQNPRAQRCQRSSARPAGRRRRPAAPAARCAWTARSMRRRATCAPWSARPRGTRCSSTSTPSGSPTSARCASPSSRVW